MRTLLIRLALIGVAALIAVIGFEGCHSLWTGRPYFGGNAYLGAGLGRLQLTDAERAAAAVRGGGPFALSCDPGVAFVLKPGTTDSFVVTASVDRWGFRRRVGGEAPPGSLRVVLLGDSVTFGFGLRDEETLASRLEHYLGLVRAVGSPDVAVSTLACPGWNVWNCGRAARDHLGRLQPDVLVYTPVANDLYDSFATTESGHRSFDFDPAVGATRPHVSYEAHLALLAAQAPLLSAADAIALRLAGGLDAIPPVSFSRATPESRRRWRGFVSIVADLGERMAARGGHFALQLLFDEPFERVVAGVLAVELPQQAVVPPLGDGSPADRLPQDAHPNAGYIDARARVLAEFLLRRGMVRGDPDGLPPLTAAYRDRRTPPTSTASAIAYVQERERAWRGRIGPDIDLTAARGAHQVYGGVEADGMVGRGCWFALDVGGRGDGAHAEQLHLVLERLPAASGLYPCSLEVGIGSRPSVSVSVPAPLGDGLVWECRVPLPAPLDDDETSTGCCDVLVTPSNYVVEEQEGRSRLACFRLRQAHAR
ncbi:MAG: hypothetical protein R3F56_17315 [Planctomycetota bacterium]